MFQQLSNVGGRLIIASDGIWDALSSDMAAKSCHGLPAEIAARQVVKVSCFLSSFSRPFLHRIHEIAAWRGLKDSFHDQI